MIDRAPTELERRVAAAQLLLDDWRDRPFDWTRGWHCGRLAAEHLRRMGYTTPLAKAGPFKSALGARRALGRLGVADVGGALDLMGLPQIPPAAALAGDIVQLPGEGELGAIAVALTNGRVLGFHQDMEGVVVMQPHAFVTAWRVTPR